MNDTNTMHELFGPTIHTYTREQAIDDGVLIDVTTAAKDCSINWSVAITQAAWGDACSWSDADDKRKDGGATWQSAIGRLQDVCWQAARAMRQAVKRGHDCSDPILFQVLRIPREGRGVRPRLTTLKLQVGPGDAGEPVITIMLPGEG